jgi:hypothetical protein
MRKLLLTSTALVAATSIASTAAADVSVTGAFEWGYTTQAADLTTNDGDSFRTDNEVTITFSSKTDSGLTITGRYDIDADSAGGDTDESSLAISGGFGKIVLGSDDDAADAFGVHEQDLIAEEASSTPTSASILTNAGESGNGDTNKVTYFTPAMGGFKAGVSTTDSGTTGVTDRTTMGASYNMPIDGGSLLVEYNQGKTDGGTDTDHQNYGATLTMGAMSMIISTATQDQHRSGRFTRRTGRWSPPMPLSVLLWTNLNTVSTNLLSTTGAKEWTSMAPSTLRNTVSAFSFRSKTPVCSTLLKCSISTTQKQPAQGLTHLKRKL